MSEQERDKHIKASDEGIDDVEAHVHHRGANDEPDDVLGHGRGDDDGGDEVEAHILKKG